MAYRVGENAGGAGFDWERATDVIAKIEEEIAEVRKAMTADSSNQKEHLTDEIGDLLFATASLARKLHVNPEYALKKSLEKFRSRFGELEKRLALRGERLEDHSVAALEEIWQQIKKDRSCPSEGQ
jgi:uncharacterized protein YabN with tetrapyrrole methylase and pyrophosphatase domain